VWRDGQKRRVFEYRFFTTGTIEEKVFQRQLSKEGLQGGLFDAELQLMTSSSDDLRDLFSLQLDTLSDTFDSLGLDKSVPLHSQQVGTPAMEALQDWGHHTSPETLSDEVLTRCWDDSVSFVFSNKVEGNIEKLTIGQ